MRLLAVERSDEAPPVGPPYQDSFDALCCQIPEDVAVVVLPPEPGGKDLNAALHVCAPSRWAPAQKIGRSFAATHGPVPHFDRVARASDALLRQVLSGEPVTRLNWSVEATDRLNLHPEPPPDADPTLWERGAWEGDDETPVFLRVERQALWGLPEANIVVFTIRVYVYPEADLTPQERAALAGGLRSMSRTSATKAWTPRPHARPSRVRWKGVGARRFAVRSRHGRESAQVRDLVVGVHPVIAAPSVSVLCARAISQPTAFCGTSRDALKSETLGPCRVMMTRMWWFLDAQDRAFPRQGNGASSRSRAPRGAGGGFSKDTA
jgi:hypothetical protein